jgi:hypothetical protein
MKKISALTTQMNVLTTSQMSLIKGGTAGEASLLDGLTAINAAAATGPISATDDEKRRERPGGGVSTH